jgi:hypothetical protein
LLLIVFGGVTDRLIPLFAIGAFLTFTLSQLGMVVHWRRRCAGEGERSRHLHLWINMTGALLTGLALIVIVVAKFTAGAWITVLVIPAVIVLLKRIHLYYENLERHIEENYPLQLGNLEPPIVLVVTASWNRMTEKALNVALSLGQDVFAVHLVNLSGPEGSENDRRLRARWRRDVEEPACKARLKPPRLVVLPATYRDLHEPVLDFARSLESEFGDRNFAVVIPEVGKRSWYEYLLHTTRAARLRTQLMRRGGERMYVICVPWRREEGEAARRR